MPQCVVLNSSEQHRRQSRSSDDAVPQVHRDACDQDAMLACAALELTASVLEASCAEDAAAILVNRLKTFLEADGVALGLVSRSNRCKLAAVAGAAELNSGTELSVALAGALNGVVRASQPTLVPAMTAQASAAEHSAHEELSSAFEPLSAFASFAAMDHCRLATPGGAAAGALIVWGAGQADRSRVAQFLALLAEPLAAAFCLHANAKKGWLRQWSRRLTVRRWLPWTILASIGVIATFWMPYRISCDCAAEPLTRRFVSAPFNGVFAKSHVRPGDLVAAGQLLGEMDGRELRIELAAVTADTERVRKSHDVNLAAGKVAAAQIDRLELERLEQQRTLLAHRTEHLAIRSPVAGYVIGGDLKRTEGAPLTMAQVLYEIAPLEEMIVEVAIDEAEIALVHIGQSVSVRFEAFPDETFVGRLERIHPRSETRDERNVFIGEVALDGNDAEMLPGMRGKARLALADESLAGGVSKRAVHAVVWFLGL